MFFSLYFRYVDQIGDIDNISKYVRDVKQKNFIKERKI